MTKFLQTLCSNKSSMRSSLYYVFSVPTKCTVLHSYIVSGLPRQCSTAQVRSITHSSVHSGPIRLSCRASRHVTGRWTGWRDALTFILPTWNPPLVSITAVDLARLSCTVAPLCWLVICMYTGYPCEVTCVWSFYDHCSILYVHMYKLYNLCTIIGQFSQQQ